MNAVGKVFVAGLGIFGISKLFSAVQAFNVTEELKINILNPRVINADKNPFSGGLEVGFELQLQNPTRGSLKVTQPYMQILSGKSVIAQSPVSQKEYNINPLSELTLDTIKFKLGWMTIITTLLSKQYGLPTLRARKAQHMSVGFFYCPDLSGLKVMNQKKVYMRSTKVLD